MARAWPLSGVRANSWPQNCGNDGKQSEPRTPLALMSLTRASMSHVPLRISSNEVGSMPYSSGGLPATALRATLAMRSSPYCQ